MSGKDFIHKLSDLQIAAAIRSWSVGRFSKAKFGAAGCESYSVNQKDKLIYGYFNHMTSLKDFKDNCLALSGKLEGFKEHTWSYLEHYDKVFLSSSACSFFIVLNICSGYVCVLES